ncbi:MAG: sulfur carrier protein ThiS [Oscillospiraceae bacterium]|jgi:thiamine biosynthesis protein ThiS|nr:sulfur carrier protein ThiS [Oscillospiraceae bacterium]
MQINGKLVPYEPLTLQEYLRREGYSADHVVVERNLEIITKERFANVTLQEMDDVNILHFMGGG